MTDDNDGSDSAPKRRDRPGGGQESGIEEQQCDNGHDDRQWFVFRLRAVVRLISRSS